MHISEGVLSAPVLLGGALLAGGGVALGLRKMDHAKIPEVAVMSSAFFVAALIHVPVGPASVHLTLNGLVGLLLGWMAFPSILVALALQALVFQFGGFTTLGVNTFIMAAPAVASYYIFGPLLRGRGRRLALAGGFCAGATGAALSAALLALSLTYTGRGFIGAAKVIAASQLPAAALEGFVTASIVAFLARVKPEMIEGPRAPNNGSRRALKGLLAAAAIVVLLPSASHAHGISVHAHEERGSVFVEGRLAGGRPCGNCGVEVLSSETGEILLEGSTDEGGMFSFRRPSSAPLRVVLRSSPGHRAQFALAASPDRVEIRGEAVEQMVEKAVDEKLRPLRREVAALRQAAQRPGVTEILGGIGYIIGLMGLALYFKYRRGKCDNG
jgi:cobalt/nickel transport system permease protein